MKKIYLAGPQVFHPRAEQWFERIRQTCLANGFEALVPTDGECPTAMGIFKHNKALIRQADYVLACVDAFRGSEPDSGTAWEIGFAHALNKEVVMYASAVKRTVRQKTLRHFGLCESSNQVEMPDGMLVENFNEPVNLMLARSGVVFHCSAEEAIKGIRQRELSLCTPEQKRLLSQTHREVSA